jgi:UPF0755 protein
MDKEKKQHRFLKLRWIAAELLLILAAALGGLYLYWLRGLEIINTMEVPARIDAYEVKKGMNARTISEDLMGEYVDSRILRIWVSKHPELGAVQRGRYRISGDETLSELLSDMVTGRVEEVEYPTLAIIEGATIKGVERAFEKYCGKCEALDRELEIPADFIIRVLSPEPELLKAIGGAHGSLEGLLAPATYPVYNQSCLDDVVARALRSAARFMAREWPQREKEFMAVDDPYEALIVASIIERETHVPEERPMVAAVFYNRLRKNMRLQTDPTVMYGISPDFSGRLTKAHLKQDSPYNTYTRSGLPPTPISMPSRSSVMAALHPAQTDALYFVAAGITPAEGHVFTNTLKEHNKAVSDYRNKVSEYRQNQKSGAAKEDKDKQGDQPKAAADQAKAGSEDKAGGEPQSAGGQSAKDNAPKPENGAEPKAAAKAGAGSAKGNSKAETYQSKASGGAKAGADESAKPDGDAVSAAQQGSVTVLDLGDKAQPEASKGGSSKP